MRAYHEHYTMEGHRQWEDMPYPMTPSPWRWISAVFGGAVIDAGPRLD